MDELERIRRKVEAGEPLSVDESAALGRAADVDGALRTSLTWGHALSNAEDDRAALAVFDRLRRDHPLHAGVRLGRARALAGLDRYGEAEVELQEALRFNPGDPEALKSLALMALRRGEADRARALVADARRADPLDAEARLIQEELTAVGPVPPPRGRAALLTSVRPVLRPAAFEATAPQAAHSLGPAGLRVFFVVDDPDLLRYVSSSMLSALSLSLAALERAAWDALEQRPTAPRAVSLDEGTPRAASTPTGLWALAESDGYDGARLLCASQRALLAPAIGPPPYRVSLARRELALVAATTDAKAQALTGLAPGEGGIPGVWTLHRDGTLEAGT